MVRKIGLLIIVISLVIIVLYKKDNAISTDFEYTTKDYYIKTDNKEIYGVLSVMD